MRLSWKVLLKFILVSFSLYILISLVLVAQGKPKMNKATGENEISFDEMPVDYSALPELSSYSCRDGSTLPYRYYPAESQRVVILLHGSSSHSQYLMPLAQYLSSENLAHVYTPDLRGHGISPAKRGDLDYINQMEDDLADLITFVRETHPSAQIVIAGHSSGGGLAIRFAGSRYNDMADAYVLLSPFLKYNAPTIKDHSGDWAQPYIARIIGLGMLNTIAITIFNHLPVMDYNLPPQKRYGSETLSYSFNLMAGFAPRDYTKDLLKIHQPALLICGKADETFDAQAFKPEMNKYCPKCEVVLLDGVTHMGVVTGEKTGFEMKRWLEKLN